ncbi:DUF2442 domain-containing protein [Paraburkholderia sp. RL17-380-BIE-A]|uniref:DUF2442 domain-containing protein n=1 Tax=Paraburkholderia sp. RL17-380-BIE-A TaxID=3031630 RepID=UPI0038BC30DF
MTNRIRPIAIEVTMNEDSFIVRLQDGGKLHVPWRQYPKLLAATPEQRRAVRISASGTMLHWDQLHQDLSIEGLLRDAERRRLEERLKSVQLAVKVDIKKL